MIRRFKKYIKKRKKITKYSWHNIDSGIYKGKTLYLPDEWGQKVIREQHESEIFKIIRSIVGPQKVFYDIGSHYGWFSLAWLSSGGAFVELFEPSIDNGKILEETIKRNKYIKKSNLHNFALGDKPHKSKLYLFPGDSSRNFVDENEQELGNNKSELFDEVQIEIIDDIYNRFSLKKPDLIKIDVEGFEYKVLLGAEQLLRDIRPIVIIEIHDVENGLLVSDFMSKIGYKLKILGYKGRNKNLPLVLWS